MELEKATKPKLRAKLKDRLSKLLFIFFSPFGVALRSFAFYFVIRRHFLLATLPKQSKELKERKKKK